MKNKLLTATAIVGLVLTIALFCNSLYQQNRMIQNEINRYHFGTWATIR